MGLKLKIDTAAIASAFKELALEVEQDLKRGVGRLAQATHVHVLKQAEGELSSPNFKKFSKAVEFDEPIQGALWLVSINEDGLWIEEGIEPNHDMKPDLLKTATKTSKDGNKYRAIPFDHTKSKSASTGYEFSLRQRIQSELKKNKIPFKKIEKDPSGNPRLGMLHKFDFGGEIPGKGNTPVLKGVSIYQTLTESGNVRRDILTFRTVSGGPASAGKWLHPGYKAKKYLDQAQEWAEKEWEQTILPEILGKWK